MSAIHSLNAAIQSLMKEIARIWEKGKKHEG